MRARLAVEARAEEDSRRTGWGGPAPAAARADQLAGRPGPDQQRPAAAVPPAPVDRPHRAWRWLRRPRPGPERAHPARRPGLAPDRPGPRAARGREPDAAPAGTHVGPGTRAART